jgi:hypothetical protein
MYMVMSLRHTELIVRRPIGCTRTYKQTKGTPKKLEKVIFACQLSEVWIIFVKALVHRK